MIFKAHSNKWLLVAKNVILTEHIDPVIADLDVFFKESNVHSTVTSGLRKPEDQLRIIRGALVTHRIADDYPEAFESMTGRITYNGETVYSWQPGWSRLLNAGFIVNPPLPAKVLMDYYRPGSEVNRKGQVIGQTPHASGRAFDIGGGPNGLNDELRAIESAMGKVEGLKGFLLERNNNCLHVDVSPTI
jgi:hypothetical protein